MGKRVQQVQLRSLGDETLYLGYVGENEHTQIIVNCTEIFIDYPEAAASIVVKPPVGDLYHAVLTRNANRLVWEITSSDVVHAGNGQAQFTFENDGEIIRSIITRTRIDPSIEATGTAPEPLQNWMDAAEATAAQMAQEAATEAAGAINNMTVSVVNGSPGATMSTVDGHKHITFSIPIPSVSNNKLVF